MPRKPVRRDRWTPEEDEELARLVGVHGFGKWALVAEGMDRFTKTCKQCRERWTNHVDPMLLPGTEPWTEEEDEKLEKLVEENGTAWARISYYFMNRSPNSLKNRYHNKRNKQISSRRTEAEGDGCENERAKSFQSRFSLTKP